MESVLAHGTLLGFTGFIILSADPGSSLFSWHPTCMALALLLLTEGVILFRKTPLSWRIGVHWAFQALGLSLAIGGVAAIYLNKEQSGKEHFVTYHGLSGIITLGLLLVQAVGGNFANYSVGLSKKFRFIKPSMVKWGHRASGGLTLGGIYLTAALALFSLWFQAVVGSNILWWAFPLGIAYPLFHTFKITYM